MDISENTRKIWNDLGKDYVRKGKASDSLDLLLEFPAQLAMVGDFNGKSVLDLGSGAGEKSFHFATNGATEVYAVDISDEFVVRAIENFQVGNLKFICGNLRNIDEIPKLSGRTFDLITCFQAMSYSDDLTLTFSAISKYLKPDGHLIVTFPSPLRFAVEKSERHQIPVAKAYKQRGLYSYPATWNPNLTVQHYLYSFSDICNAFSEVGLHIVHCEEPDLSNEIRAQYPHKAEWMDKYCGIIIYKAKKILTKSEKL